MKLKLKSLVSIATALVFSAVSVLAAPGGNSSSSVTYSGATTITSAATQSGETYTSTTADQNALLIDTSSAVTITSPTVTKSGDSDGGDNCNFYGINSGIMVKGGTTTTITGGTVTATAKGANGVFSYGGNGGTNGAAGDGTTVNISGTTINTTGDNGGGIMTTGGGVMNASDLTIVTTGQSSAPIRTDRGGGTVSVSGGSYTSQGLGSPAIYCTADITVSDATLVSQLSEGVCIEGQNSVTLTDCDLTATNTKCNGNATFFDTIMIYQSQSGDAADGTSTFTMTGGSLTSNNGHVFHVTNTDAVITLSDVTITNNDSDDILLSVCDDGWSGASNVAELNASGQTLAGTILVGSDSELTFNLSDASVYTGTLSGSISNAKGTTVSSSIGTVDVTLDSTSKWYLASDTYISSFDGSAANVIDNGYTLYVNGTALSGTTASDDDADDDDDDDDDDDADEEGYIATFVTDEHVSVTVSTTQDFSTEAYLTENAASAYARNSDTGEIDISGDGQVNFQLVVDDGYTVSSVTVSPENYKNLKIIDETSYIYRITKITGDITVTVVTEENDEESIAVVINGVTVSDDTVTAVDFTVNTEGTYVAYISVYDSDGILDGIRIVSPQDGTVSFDALDYDNETQTLKVFVWDNMDPAADVYEYEGDGIIHLNGTSIDAAGIAGVTVSGTAVTITAAGEYNIEGTLTDGQINVAASSKTDAVILNLDNVSVTSSTGNAFNATKGSVTLANVSGSTSTFVSTYSSDSDAGVGIYSKNDLTIKGADSSTKIIAKSTSGNGIRCKADLEIGAGDIEVEAGNHGIKGDESIKFTKKAGTITVNAVGDAIKTDAIDSDTLELDTDSDYLPKGTITINGGTFDLTAGGDGIQADYGFISANSPVITINSGAEGIKVNTTPADAWYYTDDTSTTTATIQGYIQINGGTFDITSSEDGIKAADYLNIADGTITIVSVLDGIQSGVDYTDSTDNTVYTNGNIAITGGTFDITTNGGSGGAATEDSCKGIKAVTALEISDGDFALNCYDDAIHSNYNITVTGGTYDIATSDDGVHADYYLTMGTDGGADDDYTMNISTCYEGLEGSVIAYLSGMTTVYATDDAVNAAGDYDEDGTYYGTTSSTNTFSLFAGPGGGDNPGGDNPGGGNSGGDNPGGDNPGGGNSGPDQGADDTSDYGMLYIKGGLLYVVSNGDGLDSNGSILMSDGVVVVNGPTSGGNGIFDVGDSSGSYFRVTGGTLVGFGTTDMQENPTVSGQSYLNTTTSLTKGSTKNIKLSTSAYLGIVPEITLSSALLFVTTPDMTSSGSVYSGTVSYSDSNKVLGRTVGSTWYGIYIK